jgi:hypothetical protein
MTDDDLFALHDEFFPTMVMGHDNYLRFARALLARYGQTAQPAASVEPVGEVAEAGGERIADISTWELECLPIGTKLYAAPVAAQPSVPTPRCVPNPDFKGDVDEATYAAGWNDFRKAMLESAATPPAGRQKQQDSQTSDEANIQHAENCPDDGCERCEALLEFYMACDKCGHIGNKNADGWAKVGDQFFCEGCAQQDADKVDAQPNEGDFHGHPGV